LPGFGVESAENADSYDVSQNGCCYQVAVEFARKYDRLPHNVFDGAMEMEWARRLAANPLLFNGSKFRLHSFGPPVGDRACVTLRLGLTNYKEFIGTNMSPLSPSMLSEGASVHGNDRAFMVRSLPCCSHPRCRVTAFPSDSSRYVGS
jgi:hypothetical protein